MNNDVVNGPPVASASWFSDFRHYVWHRPEIPTLVKWESAAARKAYSQRIMQRLDIDLDRYVILNVHRIGIDAPVKYVFEELLKWDRDVLYWPNHLAEIDRINGGLENIRLFPFGWRRYPFGRQSGPFGFNYIPLFNLTARRIQEVPLPDGFDNARYLLFDCSGGYPMGVFSMYVRSPIANEGEIEAAQLFVFVGFNFYGREDWSRKRIINRSWEAVHNRVTANVMNRLKQLCEWQFHQLTENNQSTIDGEGVEAADG